MSKYWAVPEYDLLEIFEMIMEMQFKPNGIVTHRVEKLILMFITYDHSIEHQNRKGDCWDCYPVFNHDSETITYRFDEFASMCTYKTKRTVKKYLSLLEKDGLISLKYLNKDQFEVAVNFEAILNAPKIEYAMDEMNDD